MEQLPDKKINEIAKWSGIAFQMIAIILIFVGIGYFIDHVFQTKPWCMATGSFLGSLSALYIIIKQAMVK